MPVSIGIFDYASLPGIIQSVSLLAPWPRLPVIDDFIGEQKPFKQVPLLSWVINLRETEIRTKLIAHLKTVFPTQTDTVERNINALPDAMVNNCLANLGFGVTTLYQYSLQPRIQETFCPSIYGVAQLWVGYYLFEALRKDYEEDTTNDGKYRYKQLSDLLEIVGYTLRTILSANTLQRGNKVIVSATQSSEERSVIYADVVNLGKYVDNGGSLITLASQWIATKTNPTV